MSSHKGKDRDIFIDAGYEIEHESGKIIKKDNSADIIIAGNYTEKIPEDALMVLPYKMWLST